MAQKIDGFKEPVYAVQLQRKDDDHADAHAINVNGLWGVTLGHGLVEPGEEAQKRDIRNHIFCSCKSQYLTEERKQIRIGCGC